MVDKLTPEEQIERIIDLALSEDLGSGDITSEILIPPELQGEASLLAKEKGILAGVEIAQRVFLKVDPSIKFKVLIRDGTAVKPGDIIATVSGQAISILKVERTALNFLQRLSGIASRTAEYVARAKGFKAEIADTRKTTPGLRILEKYAVKMGGGRNHRLHLGDGVLIKDNHLAALRATGMTLRETVVQAKQRAPKDMMVEVEVTSLQEAMEAAEAGADWIMLDNMSPEEMQQAVEVLRVRVKFEASGGITLDNVRQAAMTGVDLISIGALTHSPKALDISLEFDPRAFGLP
jgi:nicotinate-nucleotide pyrophosphorylase (carboxylating)